MMLFRVRRRQRWREMISQLGETIRKFFSSFAGIRTQVLRTKFQLFKLFNKAALPLCAHLVTLSPGETVI